MPPKTKGERRPADVIGTAVKVMRIATGEEPEYYGGSPESGGKDPAAVALGRMPTCSSSFMPIRCSCPAARPTPLRPAS
jgi:hypothetical protein